MSNVNRLYGEGSAAIIAGEVLATGQSVSWGRNDPEQFKLEDRLERYNIVYAGKGLWAHRETAPLAAFVQAMQRREDLILAEPEGDEEMGFDARHPSDTKPSAYGLFRALDEGGVGQLIGYVDHESTGTYVQQFLRALVGRTDEGAVPETPQAADLRKLAERL